ncbi:hypothetical protein KIH87_12940 [Paraneptunicella aestuarii]|uniref:hypothetical protein n=1 Tax=Paraneptunicella aestuarii TaxID=2831148 RepID=UPI0022B66DA2|nr:hypothetical protein [Paraneptunicella aestuarii]UAA37616.1 hypothetical protein KIH87_12940 [Paraneptunicella aestuarii]
MEQADSIEKAQKIYQEQWGSLAVDVTFDALTIAGALFPAAGIGGAADDIIDDVSRSADDIIDDVVRNVDALDNSAGNVDIPGRVKSRINIANGRTRTTPLRDSGNPVSAGFDHVLDGHFNVALGNNRSVFSIEPAELKNILMSKTVVDSPVTNLGGGQYSRIVDVGKVVGNASLNQGGGATTRIRVITDSAGNLITTYPVK